MAREARKSFRESVKDARKTSAKNRRMSAARSNLIARKKSGSPDENAYFDTGKPELQIRTKIQGASATSFRTLSWQQLR
jgi:hypothetical protein